uniref:Uncharacterized protein n=1 Tax=Plectus sambesii TaxID=2011161 RepID=A0A914VDJ9_9BILA
MTATDTQNDQNQKRWRPNMDRPRVVEWREPHGPGPHLGKENPR